MKKIAATIALLGAMLLTGGLAYGMSTVSVATGTSCGSALSQNDNGLSDAGEDACAVELSNRLAVTLALLVAGGTGVVLGGLVGAGASNAEKADRVRASATDGR